MDKKEKIFIVAITLVILIAVFLAFLVSNSKKLPPELTVQNVDKKSITSVLGGYSWKVFGNITSTDAIDLKDFEYNTNNTLVSKTNEIITASTTEKFTIQEVKYASTLNGETFDVTSKFDEAGNYFTIYSPELEGTYICLIKLDFYSKGSAEYGFKLVVTDENIYDVDEMLKYRNTKASDLVKVKEILNQLAYSKNISGIVIDSDTKTLSVKYANTPIDDRDDLKNNTIALFALVPELNTIQYEVANGPVANYSYSRDEINYQIGRDVLEYAIDSDLWKKEVIYGEKEAANEDISLYSSLISSALSKISEKDIGEYIAIDINENNTSGEINLSQYDFEKVCKGLMNEQKDWIKLESGDSNHNKGTLIKISVNRAEEENEFILNVTLITSKNNKIDAVYRALKHERAITIREGIEPIASVSGEEMISGEVNKD